MPKIQKKKQTRIDKARKASLKRKRTASKFKLQHYPVKKKLQIFVYVDELLFYRETTFAEVIIRENAVDFVVFLSKIGNCFLVSNQAVFHSDKNVKSFFEQVESVVKIEPVITHIYQKNITANRQAIVNIKTPDYYQEEDSIILDCDPEWYMLPQRQNLICLDEWDGSNNDYLSKFVEFLKQNYKKSAIQISKEAEQVFKKDGGRDYTQRELIEQGYYLLQIGRFK